MDESSRTAPDGGRLLLIGLGSAFLGIAMCVAQFTLGQLFVPWYMPILACVGAISIAVSLKRKRSAVRIAAMVAVVLLGSLQMLALNAMRLPRYEGPIEVGKPFPAFVAKRADGSTLTQADLAGASATAIVFFRGRW